MNHLLGLSFEYHRYHRDAVMRIYADDYLIDEFSLNRDIKLTSCNINDMPEYTSRIGPSYYSRVTFFPDSMFLYEINEKYLTNRIRLEVRNDQNNHTNGFMTEFSYFKFNKIWLMPKRFLEYASWKRIDKFDTFNDVKHFPYIPTRENHGSPNDVKVVSSSSEWPEGTFLAKQIGGSFTIDMPVYKKHKMIHLGLKIPPGKMGIDWSTFRMLWGFKTLNTSK